MEEYFDFIVSEKYEPVRVPTGLYSFDVAMGNTTTRGFPLGQISEIYGDPSVGKSTFSYYLAVKTATQDINRKLPDKFPIEEKDRGKYPYIILCDVEGLNLNYIQRNFRRLGYKGSLYLVPQVQKGKLLTHSKMLDIAHEEFEERGNVLILDSVGAVVSDAELESELADANMGSRARLISKFLKRINQVRLSNHGSVFLVNHLFTSLGTFQTKETAGGRTIRYLSSIRIHLSRGDVWKKGNTILATITKGKVDKLRDGGGGDTFYFVIIPDYGISQNLTAIVDCLNLFPKEFTLSDSGTLRFEGDSLGNISKFIEYELTEQTDKFELFYTRLQTAEGNYEEQQQND